MQFQPLAERAGVCGYFDLDGNLGLWVELRVIGDGLKCGRFW